LYAMRGEYSKIKKGEILPGNLGGVIAPAAASKTTVFVPIVNGGIEVTPEQTLANTSELEGGIAAIDIKTGKVEWEQEYPTAAFGSPVVINDVVFFATFDGTVRGVDANTGGELWNASLPAGSNSPVTASGDTLVVPAGIATAEGQKPALVAYRIGG
ncbi:MAG TPA: PQQ-binding-like beta-propeller repeat protein, partial [Solirubrobacterales bacterium]|nr:PQQ-binding-like beta-propeller repeat protein [Solirubrobacterales bacterium]